jgi:hypothetical protein
MNSRAMSDKRVYIGVNTIGEHVYVIKAWYVVGSEMGQGSTLLHIAPRHSSPTIDINIY